MLCEKVAGMGTFCFEKWAEDFLDYCEMTRPGEEILLFYDGYRSNFGLNALKILADGKALAYCLSAHICGTTQPLYRGVFGPFKQALSMAVDEAASIMSFPGFDNLIFSGL